MGREFIVPAGTLIAVKLLTVSIKLTRRSLFSYDNIIIPCRFGLGRSYYDTSWGCGINVLVSTRSALTTLVILVLILSYL